MVYSEGPGEVCAVDVREEDVPDEPPEPPDETPEPPGRVLTSGRGTVMVTVGGRGTLIDGGLGMDGPCAAAGPPAMALASKVKANTEQE
jgi:hypothetical protein